MRKQILATTALLMSLGAASNGYSQNFDFIADYIRYEDKREWVTVEGNIEVSTEYGYFYPDFVEYDVKNEILYLDGQLNGVLPSGQRFMTRFAELDFATQDTIVREVRGILTADVQAAAAYGENSETEKYQYAENVVASNCTICERDPRPIWQFRAEQIYRDLDEEKVYVKNGFFDIFGITVGWVPYIRIPDTTADRMEGFLTPRLIASNTDLTGVKLPYYFFLDEYTDFTITPYFTSDNVQIVEGEMRHSGKGFRYLGTGIYLINDGKGKGQRHYLNNRVNFNLTPKINGRAEFTIQSDYDLAGAFSYSNPSSDYIELEHYSDNFWIQGKIAEWRPSSERAIDGENPVILPHIQGSYSRNSLYGWQLNADYDLLHLDNDLKSDVTRLALGGEMSYYNMTRTGLIYKAVAGAKTSFYEVENSPEPENDGEASLITPYSSLDLQLPLMRQNQDSQMLMTPRFMLSWAENSEEGVEIPNNDSLFAEHDFVSLFAQDHFLGDDRNQDGLYASLGTNFSYYNYDQYGFDFGIGRIWRSDEFLDETADPNSLFGEWVAYFNYKYRDALSFTSRGAFDDDFKFSRIETGFSYDTDMSNYDVEWVRLAAEPDIGFKDVRSELKINGKTQFLPNFKALYDVRYDLVTTEPFDAGFGLTYGNECIEIKSEVNWEFQRKTNRKTERSYSFSVALPGISNKPTGKWAKHQCRY